MATKKTVAKKVAPKKATPAKKPVKSVAKKITPPAKVVKSKKPAPVKQVKKSAPAKKPVKPVAKKNTPPAKAAVLKKAPVKQVQKTVPAKVLKKTIQKKPEKTVAKKSEEVKATEVKPVAKATPKPAKAEPVKDVKIPKTTVKTSVPYQPVYTPLEKRADAPKGNEPLVRYSDNDLTEFRDLINKKMEAAKKELNYLQGLITRKDDMGTDDNDNRYMTMEDGSMSMEREQLSQMASRQITYIDHLEKAIIRIENKTYGICRVTGKLIDKARLRAVPHATLSLEAKLGLVKSNEQ